MFFLYLTLLLLKGSSKFLNCHALSCAILKHMMQLSVNSHINNVLLISLMSVLMWGFLVLPT